MFSRMLDKYSLKFYRKRARAGRGIARASQNFYAQVTRRGTRCGKLLTPPPERLQRQLPYFQSALYAGQMLKPPHPGGGGWHNIAGAMG